LNVDAVCFDVDQCIHDQEILGIVFDLPGSLRPKARGERVGSWIPESEGKGERVGSGLLEGVDAGAILWRSPRFPFAHGFDRLGSCPDDIQTYLT